MPKKKSKFISSFKPPYFRSFLRNWKARPLSRIRSFRSLIRADCERATTRFVTVESAFFFFSRLIHTRESSHSRARSESLSLPVSFAFEPDVRRENIAIIMRDIKRDETREIPYVDITADLLFQKYPTREIPLCQVT